MEMLNAALGGLPPRQLFWMRVAVAALLVLMAVCGTRAIRKVFDAVVRRMQAFAPRWMHILVSGFTEPVNLLLRAVLVYWALLVFPVPFVDPQTMWVWLTPCVRAAAVFLIGWGFWRSAPLCRLMLRSAENSLDVKTNQTMGAFFENIYRFLVVVFSLLVALEMFGVPVASLVAGAGIAGLAVSLAAQSTLSNLIAGITLVLEHPFGIGDFVTLGEFSGTVEDVSFRSTRIRTPDNVAVVVENSQVCAQYIQNLTARTSRLWTFNMRLPYDTPADKLKALCAAISRCLRDDVEINADKVSVTVERIGEDGISILVRAYTTTADYDTYLRIQDRLNRELLVLLEKHGCRLLYPPAAIEMQQP